MMLTRMSNERNSGPTTAGLFALVLALVASSVAQAQANSTGQDVAHLWACTGGGWRAMSAAMGFANLFSQIGLIPGNSTDRCLSSVTNSDASDRRRLCLGGTIPFDTISTTSGAAWFSAQFFYSEAFNSRTISPNATNLYDFVIEWMQAYSAFSASIQLDNSACQFPGILFPVFDEFCEIFNYYQGDWAQFVAEMLDATAAAYGESDFADRVMSKGNRVDALQTTNHLIQTTIMPESQIRNGTQLVRLGPKSGSEPLVYTVGLPVVYHVTSASAGFTIGDSFSLDSYTLDSPGSLSFDFYSDFGLYPGLNGTLQIPVNSSTTTLVGTFRKPFGGQTPTVAQVTATSSAYAGVLSGAVPSTFAQGASISLYEADGSLLAGSLESFLESIPENENLHDVAICSQWPNPCDELDGRFLDGSYSDTPAFVMNIANYQQESGIDKTIKVVLTNTNIVSDDTSWYEGMILSYFNTTFNEGVEPGEFIWAPGQLTPWPSSQIFDDFYDAETLFSLEEPIEGSDLSTVLLQGTTIDNPIYGVQAGQNVEILIININSDVPTMVVGETAIQEQMVPLAELALEIATNEILYERVAKFFSEGDEEDKEDEGDDEGEGDEVDEEDETSDSATYLSGAGFIMHILSSFLFVLVYSANGV